MFIQIKFTIFIRWNKDSYEYAWNCKSLIAYDFYYECTRDQISFLVDRKLKSINIHVKNIKNRLIITAPRLWFPVL